MNSVRQLGRLFNHRTHCAKIDPFDSEDSALLASLSPYLFRAVVAETTTLVVTDFFLQRTWALRKKQIKITVFMVCLLLFLIFFIITGFL